MAETWVPLTSSLPIHRPRQLDAMREPAFWSIQEIFAPQEDPRLVWLVFETVFAEKVLTLHWTKREVTVAHRRST